MRNYHQFIDDLMTIVNIGSTGAELHAAAKNRQISAAMKCANCVSTIYLSMDKLYHTHFHHNAQPPIVSCPNCGHSSDQHSYVGISQ